MVTNFRSIAVEFLKKQLVYATAKVVYVYFDYTTSQTQQVADVARSLLKQLVAQSRDLSRELDAAYDNSIQSGCELDLSTCLQHLKRYSQVSPIYAVFDAMDECEENYQQAMFQLFAELQNCGYRIMISSRPHLWGLEVLLSNIQTFEIIADESDLRNYIISKLRLEKNNNCMLEAKCMDLVNGVNGM